MTEPISYVCDFCFGDNPDCCCRREPSPTDCDHKGARKGSYWCGYCIHLVPRGEE
jgi:hypothetical protein